MSVRQDFSLILILLSQLGSKTTIPQLGCGCATQRRSMAVIDQTVNTQPTILCIGGYIHSGSTITDMLLGMNAGAFALGELTLIFRELVRGDRAVRCSCGKRLLDECPVWSAVIAQFQVALPEISLERAAYVTRKVEMFPDRWINGRRYQAEYDQIWRTMFKIITEITGATLLIDSSKTGRGSFYRSASLATAGFDVRVLHLVRDPRAVIYSVQRFAQKKYGIAQHYPSLLYGMKTAISWSITNLITTSLSLSGKISVDRVRYEDLVAHPIETLKKVERALNIDLSDCIQCVRNDDLIQPGHITFGNDIRMHGPTRLRPQAASWRSGLSSQAKLGAMICWPVARFYGYHLTGSNTS